MSNEKTRYQLLLERLTSDPALKDVYKRQHRHYHAKCSQCGRVFDIEMDYLEDLARLVKDAHGFAIDGHNLVFTGICPACRETVAQNESPILP